MNESKTIEFLILNNNNVERMTVEELDAALSNGSYGMLHFNNGYDIEGWHYIASSLSLYPDETKIFERNGSLSSPHTSKNLNYIETLEQVTMIGLYQLNVSLT